MAKIAGNAALNALERAYILKERGEVLNFIDENPFLIDMLSQAPSRIHGYFPNSPLLLKLDTDPEMPEFNSLTIFIKTSLLAEEAIQKLDQLDEEWWGNVLANTQGKLSINLEC